MPNLQFQETATVLPSAVEGAPEGTPEGVAEDGVADPPFAPQAQPKKAKKRGRPKGSTEAKSLLGDVASSEGRPLRRHRTQPEPLTVAQGRASQSKKPDDAFRPDSEDEDDAPDAHM